MARTLIVGDVHGCADELRRLLDAAAPERVVLVGDLFTRGPDPVGVWKLIRAWNAEAVLGNRDLHVLDRWRPGRDLPKKAFRWLRERPLVLKGDGWLAVHAGIDPIRGPDETVPWQALHLRRYGAGWWWEQYRGADLVLHGHDAARGLNDRRPYTLGLDTGCVKGGRLTGFLVEEDRLVSVKARATP